MNSLLLRLAPAVALCLPLLALAQASRGDPADARTLTPALSYQSAFADYKPWHDVKPADWRAVNENVRDAAVNAAGHGGHAMPLTAPAAASAPAPAPKASSPTMPGHDGHNMHGGKQ